jgi:hypothetical protein
VIVTSLLVRWNNGWSEVTRPDAIAAHGRKEAFLALGAVQARDEMTTVSTRQLAIFGDPRTEIAADLEHVDESDTPYVAFGVGDRVTVPDIPGHSPSLERVTSITVAVDENGHVTYAPELRDNLLTERERFAETVTKMANGSLGGDSRVATPAAFVPSTAPPPMATPATSVGGFGPMVIYHWPSLHPGEYGNYATGSLDDHTLANLYNFPEGANGYMVGCGDWESAFEMPANVGPRIITNTSYLYRWSALVSGSIYEPWDGTAFTFEFVGGGVTDVFGTFHLHGDDSSQFACSGTTVSDGAWQMDIRLRVDTGPVSLDLTSVVLIGEAIGTHSVPT